MAGVDDILDQCVQQVLSGRSTLDDCLAQNPQHADLLRPLLHTALQIGHLDRPQASRAGFHAGKQLMMEAVARKEQQRTVAREPMSDSVKRWLAFPRARMGGRASLTRLTAVGVLGAATLLVWVAAAGVLLQLWYGSLLPQTAVVADASGITQVQAARDAAWQPLVTGWVLEPGHRIRTGDPASVGVNFSGGGSTSLGPNSQLEIVQLGVRRDGRGQVIVLQQAAGSTHNRVNRSGDFTTLFEIETTGASVVAHGTEFKVHVNSDSSTSVVVLEGAVSVTGRGTTVTLTGGQAIVVDVDEAPGPVVLAPPEELVESQSAESGPQGDHVATATPEMPTRTATLEPAGPALESQPPTATATSRPPSPTATLKPPSPTTIPRPPSPTATPRPPTPTATQEPPSPTATSVPSPTLEPIEIVEVYYAYYTEDEEKLWVKARTNIVGCTLMLEGFGPMEAEGDHWVYVEESLEDDDVPSMVTVRSSCGGSGSSAVRWR